MVIERLARLGYASIGIVYMLVGGFAVAAGLHRRGTTGSQKDAFALILRQPFGRVALTVVALGVIGYALWRYVSSVTDTEHRGSDPKGLAIRAGSFFRGIGYSFIAFEVIKMIKRGSGGSGGDQQARHWTGRVMDAPFGKWLVLLAGLSFITYGAYQLYAAWDSKLSKRLSLGRIDGRVREKVVAVSRFGIGARGVVLFIIGGSLVRAALRHSPGAARGTSGALAQLPDPMLVVAGFGLAAYGVYALVNARYRRIEA
jgi:Domain of Unknown Function (DUF1206)